MELKRTSDAIEKILRQPEALSEPIDQQILMQKQVSFGVSYQVGRVQGSKG